jgi:hypothetical protein
MAKQIDLVSVRMEFLKQMDYYVKNIIGNDSITERWLMGGLPDGYDETDLKDIAIDDELWLDCVNCFARCSNGKEI